MGVAHYISLIPLSVCLFPGEREIISVDEDRYGELIDSLLQNQENFGIPCSNLLNTLNIGSLVRLEKVSPVLGTNQISIQIYCTQLFQLTKFYYRHSKGRWPGGEIREFEDSIFTTPLQSNALVDNTAFQLSAEIHLSLDDRLKLLKFKNTHQIEQFLEPRKRVYDFSLEQELAVTEGFYLN
jgi:hypothetical protein